MNLSPLAAGTRFASLIRSPDHRATLLRGTAGSLLNKVISSGLLFGSQIIFARALGLQEYGFYVIALAWLGVLVLFGRLGFDMATVRFVAQFHDDAEFGPLRGFLFVARSTAVGASIIVGGVFLTIMAIFGDAIGAAQKPALVLAAAIVPALALVQVEAAAIRGTGRVVLGDVPLSAGHPLLLIGIFFAATFAFDMQATAELALAAYLAATVVTLLLLWPILRTILPDATHQAKRVFRWREWTGTAAMMTMVAGFGVLLAQMTVILTGWLAGPETAGLFSAAGRLASTLLIVSFSLCTAIAPRAAGGTDRSQLQEALDTGLKTIVATCAAIAVVLIVFAEWLLGLFGPAFVEAKYALIVMAAGQVVAAAAAPAGIVLNMLGGQRVAAAILGAVVVVNAVLIVILVPAYGLLGAAIATAVTTAGSPWIMAVAARRRFGLRTAIWMGGPNERA